MYDATLKFASILLTKNMSWLLLLQSNLQDYCISHRLVCNAADFYHSEYRFFHQLVKSEPLSLIKLTPQNLISQQVTDSSEKHISHVQLKNGTVVVHVTRNVPSKLQFFIKYEELLEMKVSSADLLEEYKPFVYHPNKKKTKLFYWFQEKLWHLIPRKLKFVLNQCSLNWSSSVSDRLHTQNQSH